MSNEQPAPAVAGRLDRQVRRLHQRVLCWLFAIIYRRWLWDDWCGKPATVIKVRGWRTAIIQIAGQRRTMTACFWWLD